MAIYVCVCRTYIVLRSRMNPDDFQQDEAYTPFPPRIYNFAVLHSGPSSYLSILSQLKIMVLEKKI